MARPSPLEYTLNRRPEVRLSQGRLGAGWIGLVLFILVAASCLITLPWSMRRYDVQQLEANQPLAQPSWSQPMGTDPLGRSILWRSLLGGAISLGIGISAASVAIVIGVVWGAVAGYAGGRTDTVLMRVVDVLYGLPYILLVVLLDIAVQPKIERLGQAMLPSTFASELAQVVTLLLAIGGVSWLTMARVIRGQVLSLREQPFVEAARACGAGPAWVVTRHVLPNLIGPITVYGALAVPTAILQESFLSFLGIGVQAPLPSWGNLAADGLRQLHALGQPNMPMRWWLLAWPCVLLGVTLLSLNVLGDALRHWLDPRPTV